MIVDRRTFIAMSGAPILASPLAGMGSEPTLFPEDFGAKGDGETNDGHAFKKLSDRLHAMGGGTVSLRAGKTYVVGSQTASRDRPFNPAPVLEFDGLTRPLTILGNGARLRAAPGLRFGAFDVSTGRPSKRPMPNVVERERAAPYVAMIAVRRSLAPVTIRDVELDGNVRQMEIGGQWGDTGWQVPGSGLALSDNVGEERVENVFSHHHPLDGAMIDGRVGRTARSRFKHVRCAYNGRQGLSIVGGNGYDFEDCVFSKTGRSRLRSSPGAGVDIEAEGTKTVRGLSFKRCKFIDNAGPGMGADSGDSADAYFSECLFVGTTSWAALPHKPGFRFEDCIFAGTVIQAYASKDPSAAAKFARCLFTDDPKYSPTGRLFVGHAAGNGIVNLGESDNILFVSCRFVLNHNGVLPWSWRAIYQDCTMRQLSRTPAMTKGKYLGRNVIDGPVELYGSMILGTVILNGKTVPRGPFGSDFQPW